MTGSNPSKGWTNVNSDTQYIFSDLDLLHGQDYFISVRSIDKAGNYSDISFSNGITVDLVGPSTGQIIDGDSTDIVKLGDSDTIKTFWVGFYDDFSGIKEYQLSVGTSPHETDQVDWFSVDSSITNYTFEDLELINGRNYFVSIKALDGAGNYSDVLTSNGIFIDGNPPYIVHQTYPEGSIFPLVNRIDQVLKFDEPLKNVWMDVLGFDSGTFQYSFSQDTLDISFNGPFSSLDTFQIYFTFADIIGNHSDTIIQNYFTSMHADFNHDYEVNASDLAIFIDAWKMIASNTN